MSKPLGYFGLDWAENENALQLTEILEDVGGNSKISASCASFLMSYCAYLHHSYQTSQPVDKDEEDILWLMIVGNNENYTPEESLILMRCRELIYDLFVQDMSQMLPIIRWLAQ